VRFPENRKFDRYVDSLLFSKHGEQIGTVDFNLEPQTAETAYQTALGLARDWQLDTAPLDEWYGRVSSGQAIYGPGPPTVAATRRNDRPLTASLDIFHSYRRDKPFRIAFQVGWADR